MKKVAFYLLFLFTVFALTAVTPTATVHAANKCYPPPTGLTGWWPGDGSTADLIGGRDAVLHNDATFGPGLVGQAFLLDGDGDFVDVPHDLALNPGTDDFTVAVWVKFNHTVGEQVLAEKWIQRFSSNSERWTLTKLEGNIIRLALSDGTGPEIDVDSRPLRIRPGAWIHFAATRQAGRVTLFMNGRPIATGMSDLNLDTDASLKFGHRGNPADTPGSEDENGFFLNGQIDEVQLFIGTALPRKQIQKIVNARGAGICKDALRMDLRVNYGHDWVESFYEAGHNVRITVTESDGVTVKATARVITEPDVFWGVEPGFQTRPEDWKPAPPDLQPYDWVYAQVNNGVRAQVQLGDIGGTIDLAADSIQGTVSAPWFADEVLVECHPWGSPQPAELKFDTALPDGSDVYACSWAGEWDIQPRQDVGASYYGLDGHWVANAFVRNPHIVGSVAGDWLATVEFNPGTLTLFIYESPAEDAPLLWQGSREADETRVTQFSYEDHGQDLVPGNYLVVTDGAFEKGLLLETFTIERFDSRNEIMAGTAPGGLEVLVVAGMAEAETQGVISVIADLESSVWSANFRSIRFNITEAMRPWSFARIFDEDGDANEAGTPPAP
jgi:hypothetical protein